MKIKTQKLWGDTVEVVLRGTFIASNAYIIKLNQQFVSPYGIRKSKANENQSKQKKINNKN